MENGQTFGATVINEEGQEGLVLMEIDDSSEEALKKVKEAFEINFPNRKITSKILKITDSVNYIKSNMNKKEFQSIFNMATALSQQAFSALGLAAKNFVKAHKELGEDLADENYYMRGEYCLKEGSQWKRDDKGNPIFDDSKTKEYVSAVKAWGKEEVEVDWGVFTPVQLKGKLLFMSPEIYATLNGYVFNVPEDVYLESLETEVIRQDKEKEAKEAAATKSIN